MFPPPQAPDRENRGGSRAQALLLQRLEGDRLAIKPGTPLALLSQTSVPQQSCGVPGFAGSISNFTGEKATMSLPASSDLRDQRRVSLKGKVPRGGGILMGVPAIPELQDGEDEQLAAARHLVELVADGRTVLHAFEIQSAGSMWEVVVRLRLVGGD